MPTTEQFATALAGRYTIERQIGAGGMATVYLGHDVRHRRPVAVKFLNPELGAVVGAERFASEIEVTANLQHPHILPLFDSGEASLPGYAPGRGVLFYVMPYVDGETLRQRLARERQLSIDEAVRIARAVASALDYAHRHGVIHRDLKPENILLHDGEPLVADFGIALALSNAAGERITQSGISLGTPQYMSPEQAAGDRQLDARSDVYSLGTVLYEMLAGEPPHTGPTVQAVIAKVISEPSRPIEQLRHTVPTYVSAALECALAKVPSDRFATAGEFSAALTPGAPAHAMSSRITPRRARPSLAWAVVAALGAALVWGSWKGGSRSEEPSIAAAVRATIDLPSEAPLALGVDIPNAGYSSPLVALSPDGAWLAWVAETSVGRLIYLRDMSTGDVRPLLGTEGAIYAFFSPDAKSIGFLTTDHVSKIPRDGGAVTLLCDVATPVVAWWTTPETIYVAADETSSILLRVSADGGTPERLAPTKDVRSSWLRYSDVLEGGRFALATQFANGGEHGDVVLVDLESGKAETLVRGAHAGRYAPPGHLIFARSGAIFEVHFDLSRRTTSGDPVKLVAGATTESRFGVSHAAFSMNGVAVFLPGSDLSVGRPAWIDRAGKVTYIDSLPERVYGSLDLSPNGDRIAFQIPEGENDYFWIWDLARREGRKAGFQKWERFPVWSPDGRHLSGYTQDGRAKLQTVIHDVSSEGVVGEGRILTGLTGGAVAWSPTSDTILLADPTQMSIARLSDPGRSEPARALVRGMYSAFSPDGRWIAYSSPRNGIKDVWLQSFPQGKAAGQISSTGGWDPRWLPSGSLFYRTGNRWWTTRVSTVGAPRWDPPRKVFETEDFIHTPGWSYDVSSDGQRLLIVKRTHPLVRSKIEVISHWPALLKLAH